ncbi:hypothetical protein LSH36_924g00051 [Paralvinella palmiformis]|uniref:Uncharacterized protein n=1 Tax=Paralvinella palmiformis TaxID=53620 RepID=A0AAD9MTQ6_9ANNE|nr:hypothetical protein LSH36_924g00051 [Paralvinella palmiformis]
MLSLMQDEGPGEQNFGLSRWIRKEGRDNILMQVIQVGQKQRRKRKIKQNEQEDDKLKNSRQERQLLEKSRRRNLKLLTYHI